MNEKEEAYVTLGVSQRMEVELYERVIQARDQELIAQVL